MRRLPRGGAAVAGVAGVTTSAAAGAPVPRRRRSFPSIDTRRRQRPLPPAPGQGLVSSHHSPARPERPRAEGKLFQTLIEPRTHGCASGAGAQPRRTGPARRARRGIRPPTRGRYCAYFAEVPNQVALLQRDRDRGCTPSSAPRTQVRDASSWASPRRRSSSRRRAGGARRGRRAACGRAAARTPARAGAARPAACRTGRSG